MTNNRRLSLVFMGTPDYAARSLEALAAAHDVRLVVTQPDRPRGRGKKLAPSPVKSRALELGIPVAEPGSIRSDAGLLQTLRQLAPDAIVVVAYGQILPQSILDLPPLGCINLHASLLPAWRGAAPIQQAIMAGDTASGNTTMLMEAGLDTGPILLMDEVAIAPEMTYGQLHDQLMERGGALLLKTLAGLAEGTLEARPQPEAGVSYVRKLTKEDALIDFRLPGEAIVDLIRAMNPVPLAFAWNGEVMVKILEATAEPSAEPVPPGTILSQDRSGIRVRTGDGALNITKLQLPGKKPMAVTDFLNGNRLAAPTLERSVS